MALREAYREISLYAPNRAPCRIDLSDNTNLWGIPPAAERALREVASRAVTRYPNLYAQGLKDALANYLGVRPENVVTGCGSDDVLDSALRAFADPGQRIAFPDPTFAMLPLFSRMNALTPVTVPLTASGALDPDALLAAGARVIYVCSPNNPTGTPAARDAIERLLGAGDAVLLLDEAYAEYASTSWAAEAPGHERLLVVRTLSKAFGLAGMRVGYAIGAPALVAEVEKSRGPYKVTAPAEAMAIAALTEGLPWVRARVDEAKENRARLRTALSTRGFQVLPSEANFLLVGVADATQTAGRMRERGVAVRPFPAVPGFGDAVRISIGPWPLLEEALAALEASAR